MRNLRRKLEKVDDANEDSITTDKTLSDIRKFLNNEIRFENNQEILSMRNMFRRTTMKRCTGDDFDASEDRKHNKTIAKESVLFCNEFWVERCKKMHDEKEQKKRFRQWYGNVLNETLNGESEKRRHVEINRLNIDRAPNDSIRS